MGNLSVGQTEQDHKVVPLHASKGETCPTLQRGSGFTLTIAVAAAAEIRNTFVSLSAAAMVYQLC